MNDQPGHHRGIHPTSQAHDWLPRVAAAFRRDGMQATPVVFGSHGTPEGALLPFALYERLTTAIDDIQFAEHVADRLARPTPTGTFNDLAVELGFPPDDFTQQLEPAIQPARPADCDCHGLGQPCHACDVAAMQCERTPLGIAKHPPSP